MRSARSVAPCPAVGRETLSAAAAGQALHRCGCGCGCVAAPVPPRDGVRPARGRSSSAEHGDRGAGTVLVLGLVLVGLLLATATAVLGQAVVARHRAMAAADLAALAAADVLLGRVTGDVCGAARRTAEAGGAKVTGCAPAGQEVVVRVAVPVDGLLAALGPASAAARAGPSAPAGARP